MENKLKAIQRNDFGLIIDGNYVFNEDGTVNWRKMIKPEYLVPNRQYFEKKGKPVPDSIEGLEDRELLILLGGLKDLAQIRGYNSVHHTVSCPNENIVVSSCSIAWIPNYETEGRQVNFSAIGDATIHNTTGFGSSYLGPIAENRAFVRAVRNFLKVNIVSQEELGAPASENNNGHEDASSSALKEVMEKHNVSFDLVKERLIAEKFSGAENLKSISDIPTFKKFEIIERIKQKAAKRTT